MVHPTIHRLLHIAKGTLRSLAVVLNNFYCIPTYVLWCVILHPLYIWKPDLYWMIEGQFFQWLLTMVAYWSYSAGYYIVESGDIIEQIINDETLVLVNHQSTSDVPLLMYAFSARNNLLQRLNWIMDAVFQYTNFGIVSKLHGDFFIHKGRERRDSTLKDLKKYLATTFLPRRRKWLLLFPEGGFLRKRQEVSKRYATRMGLPNLEYVTVPRLGALQTIIDSLAPTTQVRNPSSTRSFDHGAGDSPATSSLKYIIDMTIAYPKGVPLDLGTVITGSVKPCAIRMHYKIYPLSEVPYKDPDQLQTWLYNLYIEKNNILGHYYKTGVFSPEYRSVDVNQVSKMSESDGLKDKLRGIDMVDEACQSAPHVILDGNDIVIVEKPTPESNDTELLEETSAKLEEFDDCTCDSLPEDEFNELKTKTLHLDLLRITLLHIMFIASTFLHCSAVKILYNYVFHES